MANLPPGADSNSRLKRFLVMIDSMTAKERECRVALDESRILRIARGSGVHPQEVGGLMETHRQFSTMISGMNKTGLLKGTDAAFASKMSRNPNAVMSQLQRSMDPRMLQQIGGAGNLMDIMRGVSVESSGSADVCASLSGVCLHAECLAVATCFASGLEIGACAGTAPCRT